MKEENVEGKKNLHAGHRERMRNRFLTSGFDDFAPHEILEFILFYTNPRCNTNNIAHTLIETFGSLHGVLDASYEELVAVDKVGPIGATFLTCLPALFRRYCKDKEETREPFNTLGKLKSYCRSLYIGATVENFYLLLFDNSMRLLDCSLLAYGTVNSVPVKTRTIAEKVLEKHASCVVISHNHPGGTADPSPEDLAMTNMIENALKILQIPLLEHILVAENQCTPLIYETYGLARNHTSGDVVTDGFLRSFYGLDKG